MRGVFFPGILSEGMTCLIFCLILLNTRFFPRSSCIISCWTRLRISFAEVEPKNKISCVRHHHHRHRHCDHPSRWRSQKRMVPLALPEAASKGLHGSLKAPPRWAKIQVVRNSGGPKSEWAETQQTSVSLLVSKKNGTSWPTRVRHKHGVKQA
jgi:hypothetical protein